MEHVVVQDRAQGEAGLLVVVLSHPCPPGPEVDVQQESVLHQLQGEVDFLGVLCVQQHTVLVVVSIKQL